MDLIRRIGGGEITGAPGEFQIFPAGQLKFGDETIIVDDLAIAKAIELFEAKGEDMVIDYEHQTEGGKFASPDGTAPAAGWIKRLINKGKDGLWAVVEWTDRACDHLAKREYRYYSPVFFTAKDGRLVELLRVALTNAPKLTRLQPLVAKDGAAGSNDEEGTMLNELLIEALGMDPGASDEEIVAKVKELAAAQGEGGDTAPAEAVAAKDIQTLADALGLGKDAGVPEMVAHVAKLQMVNAGQPDLAAQVAKLVSDQTERTAKDLVDAASLAGKLTPAQMKWAVQYAKQDQEGFSAWVAVAPVVVTPGKLKVAKDVPGGPDVQSEESKLYQKKMGISDADRGKYGPKGGQ